LRSSRHLVYRTRYAPLNKFIKPRISMYALLAQIAQAISNSTHVTRSRSPPICDSSSDHCIKLRKTDIDFLYFL